MGKTPHIVIIGAGLIGLSTADSLATRGARVTMIERRSGPGQGASFSNSGMIHLSQAAPWLEGNFENETKAVLALAQHSRALLAERMKSLGLSVRPGVIQLFDSIVFGQQAAERYTHFGIASQNVTGQTHTYGRYALLFPEDRSGDAYAYCQALETSLKVRGVDIVYGSKYDAEKLPEADHIVICAGTGSPAVAASYGAKLPVVPLRGHALNFKRPKAALPNVPIMHHASRSALTVFEDHVRLSGTIGEDSPEALIEIWEEIAPDLLEALGSPISTWSEDRPVSQLGRPIITQIAPNIWANSGHAHMGWTLSAGAGDLMARMIVKGHVDNRFGLEA